ncbi:MAG: heavy-metal-associated domain-containing protein [Bacteroidales bacterium]|jgi:mercuric ion binding protein|nr:heavy-metal-associated domain-containing protein [Bacteroidales bacterium]
MKTKMLSLISMFLLGTSMVFAQTKTEKFEVNGNCSMCEQRIETAAKSVDGVASADWNQETKMLHVSYDESNTSMHKIQMAIANVGHDTPMHKASDEVYNALPGCCQYTRTDNTKEMKKNMNSHKGCQH